LVGKANQKKKKRNKQALGQKLGWVVPRFKQKNTKFVGTTITTAAEAAVGHLGLLGTGPRHVDSFNPTTPVWVGDDSPLLKPIAQS
jgi:hypothetical protein